MEAIAVYYGESVTLRLGPVTGLPEDTALEDVAVEIEFQVKERLGQEDGALDANILISKLYTDDDVTIDSDDDGDFVEIPLAPADYAALPRIIGKYYCDVWITTAAGERKPLLVRPFQVNGVVNLP